MYTPPPSLESMYPPWRIITDKYESLFSDLKARSGSAADYGEKEEALFWENYGFELMITLLVHRQIPFEAGAEDVQPIIEDENGVPKEVDFRIRILNTPVLFGVTHFRDGPKDLEKDIEPQVPPIRPIRRNGVVAQGSEVIVASRPHREYMNRRIAVRIAREGKTRFPHDYIYILFPQCALGFGGGLDCISQDFSFDTDSKYRYRPIGMTGLILIGQHIKATPKEVSLSQDQLLVRTLAFPSSSPVASGVLQSLDHFVINERKRNQQVREIMARCRACPQSQACPYEDLRDCPEMRGIVGE